MEKRELKILIVEDDPDYTTLLKKFFAQPLLTDEKYRLFFAQSLNEGLRHLKNEAMDVVLLDLYLPDSRGLDTFRKIYSHSKEKPIVILTILEDRLGLSAIQEGAQDYLLKEHVNQQTLLRSIHYAVERKKLERMKEEFVEFVSHELRTPLTVMQAMIDNLKEGVVGKLETQQAKVVENLHNHVRRLGRLIEKLLSFSRLKSNVSTLEKKPIDVEALISEITRHFQIRNMEKKVVLTQEVEKGLPPIFADEDRCIELLDNLVENALRFAKARVTLVAKRAQLEQGKGVEISVQDDGPGVGEKEKEKIFQKFVRFRPKSEKGKYQGSGLGLAICREIVQQHGGRLWVESDPGRGAQFHCILPE